MMSSLLFLRINRRYPEEGKSIPAREVLVQKP